MLLIRRAALATTAPSPFFISVSSIDFKRQVELFAQFQIPRSEYKKLSIGITLVRAADRLSAVPGRLFAKEITWRNPFSI
jgi:hypothetical protein